MGQRLGTCSQPAASFCLKQAVRRDDPKPHPSMISYRVPGVLTVRSFFQSSFQPPLSTQGSVLCGWSEVFWKPVLKCAVLPFSWGLGATEWQGSAAYLMGVDLLNQSWPCSLPEARVRNGDPATYGHAPAPHSQGGDFWGFPGQALGWEAQRKWTSF